MALNDLSIIKSPISGSCKHKNHTLLFPRVCDSSILDKGLIKNLLTSPMLSSSTRIIFTFPFTLIILRHEKFNRLLALLHTETHAAIYRYQNTQIFPSINRLFFLNSVYQQIRLMMYQI